jgi:hypothetical protein
VAEYGFRDERGLEFIERVMCQVEESKNNVLLAKGSQWKGNGRIMVNEVAVKNCEA